jgi:hypothetical protein
VIGGIVVFCICELLEESMKHSAIGVKAHLADQSYDLRAVERRCLMVGVLFRRLNLPKV